MNSRMSKTFFLMFKSFTSQRRMIVRMRAKSLNLTEALSSFSTILKTSSKPPRMVMSFPLLADCFFSIDFMRFVQPPFRKKSCNQSFVAERKVLESSLTIFTEGFFTISMHLVTLCSFSLFFFELF